MERPLPIQLWMNANKPEDNLIWKQSWLNQLMFFRGDIAPLFAQNYNRKVIDSVLSVISTHISKSTTLPVYRLHRDDIGLTMIFRNNYYNWKMSVISERPIDTDLSDLFFTSPPVDPEYTGDPLARVYFEGFSEEFVFGYYSENNRKFSAEIRDDNTLFTTVFLILRTLGVVKSKEWATRETRNKYLNERDARERAEREENRKTQRYSIVGSGGTLAVTYDGEILKNDKDIYSHIKRFDVEEYRTWANKAIPMDMARDGIIGADILEMGFWVQDSDGKEAYVPADSTFRDNVLFAYKSRISLKGRK